MDIEIMFQIAKNNERIKRKKRRLRPSKLVLELSVTGRTELKRCQRRFYYNEMEGLDLKVEDSKRIFGTMIHRALEVYHKDGKNASNHFENEWNSYCEYANTFEEIEDLRNLKELGISMLKGYVDYWYCEKEDSFETIGTEVELLWDFETTDCYFILRGKVDWLALKDERVYVIDHKTTANRVSVESLEWEADQLNCYIYMLQKILGKQVAGMYNFLRKKIPTVPAVLRSGGLSKAKAIDTTHAVYLQAIIDNQLPINDYQEMLQMLKEKETDFFQRIPIKRAPEYYEALEKGIVSEFEMLSKSSKYSLKSICNPTRDCNWDCSFKRLCRALSIGAGNQALIEKYYIKRRG